MNVELPEEYADWVEAKPPLGASRWVSVEVRVGGIGSAVRVLTRRYFVPPKPKPTLPDVGLGAVLAYTDKSGRKCRAMQFASGDWRVYTFAGEIVVGHPNAYWTNGDLITHVNDDGFTVELEGLE